jgi:hypothetical protein
MTIKERMTLYEIKGYLEAIPVPSATEYSEFLADFISKYANEPTCNIENRPVDKRKGEGWISISAEDVGAETDGFRYEIEVLKDAQMFLETRIKKLERAFWGE